jgi:hypothetical protein
LPPLVGVERGAQRLSVFARHPRDLVERQLSLLGQVQRVAAPVLWLVAPLDEPVRLELIHERHEVARKNAQPLGERTLADPGGQVR